jgi:hypothetical protein
VRGILLVLALAASSARGSTGSPRADVDPTLAVASAPAVDVPCSAGPGLVREPGFAREHELVRESARPGPSTRCGEGRAAAAAPCTGCHVGAPAGQDEPTLARDALVAIDALDLARAHALLGAARGDGPSLRFARGVLALHEQRYADAMALLEGATGPAARFLAAARAGAELTAGHRHRVERRFALSYAAAVEPAIAPLLAALERQEAALGALLGGEAPARIPIEIVADRGQLARAVGLAPAEVARSGTVAAVRYGKLALLAPATGIGDTAWLDTAAHEYTHLALAVRTRDRMPIWLQEGFAGFLEARWRGAGPALPAAALARVRLAAERGALVPLVEMHPSLALLRRERAALAQAQVVLAVEWLQARRGPSGLAAIVAALRDGASAEDAVAAAMGEPFRAVEAAVARHAAARPLPEAAWRTLHELRARDGGEG